MALPVVRLIQYSLKQDKTNSIKLGALLTDNKIFDLHHIPFSFNNLNNLIAAGISEILNIKKFIQCGEHDKYPLISKDEVCLCAPIVPIRNVICIGKNYVDHIAEVQNLTNSGTSPDIPKFPMFFSKMTTSVVGPDAMIENHQSTTKYLDYEAELAVIIGKQGKNISYENAMDHIFGYTIGNDITARDLQRQHGQFFKGKSLDTSCPLGPWVIPACDLDPSDLAIQLYLNDKIKQNSRTSKMIFKIPKMIEILSRGTTLLPGDVILTGTPDGVGYAAMPPRTLLPNDRVRVVIEGIGELVNYVEP